MKFDDFVGGEREYSSEIERAAQVVGKTVTAMTIIEPPLTDLHAKVIDLLAPSTKQTWQNVEMVMHGGRGEGNVQKLPAEKFFCDTSARRGRYSAIQGLRVHLMSTTSHSCFKKCLLAPRLLQEDHINLSTATLISGFL